MTEFTSYDPGTPCWTDLMSPDVDASKRFYMSVFGWDAVDQFDDEGNRIYTNFQIGDKEIAGVGGGADMGDMPAVWNTYIATADVDATAAAITEAGGSVIMSPMQVVEAGRMAVFADPTGAAFSVWEAGRHIGSEICNEPNTPSWHELLNRDVDAAMAFYSAVFGWSYDTQDTPTGPYHVIAGGENDGLGAVMPMPAEIPEQVPNHWMAYFTVADIDETIDKVASAGGQVVNGPFPIPGIGRIAVVHDDQNASFSLMEPSDDA